MLRSREQPRLSKDKENLDTNCCSRILLSDDFQAKEGSFERSPQKLIGKFQWSAEGGATPHGTKYSGILSSTPTSALSGGIGQHHYEFSS